MATNDHDQLRRDWLPKPGAMVDVNIHTYLLVAPGPLNRPDWPLGRL